MSNASNLSTLANILDDGSSGQFLKSTGSGGVAFDTVAAGAVVYATADLLPLSGFAAGDMAYVTATNRFYINNGSGWYSISLVNTNPNITSVQDAGSNTTPFTLATDGTATVITVTAADPEDVPLTYGYSVTTGNASLNGSTVAQGTGSNTNVFTVTPHASQDATFTITFTASDGINQATSANAFSLSFVTIVTDSNHTTLLATATGTSDNNNITYIDGSGNTQNATVNGNTCAGTFSPYRSGGYSWKFDGSNDHIQIADSTDFDFGSGDFTIEGFYKLNDASGNQYLISISGGTSSSNHFGVNVYSGNWRSGDFNGYMVSGVNTGIDTDSFHHFSLVRSSNNLKFYIDGTQIGSTVDVTNQTFDCAGNVRIGGFHSTGNFAFNGYLRDIRFVKGTAITPPSGGPTEPLEVVTNTVLLLCHATYLKDGSSNDHSITINGSPTSEPLSPYDYDEYSATDHGGSVYFDGSGDYLTLGSGAVTAPSGDFTVEAWAYPTGASSGANGGTVLCFGANNGIGLRIFWDVNGNHFRFLVTGASSTGAYIYDTNIDTATPNAWYHVAAVRTSGLFKFYVNGVLQGTENNSVTFEQSAFNLARIGYNTQNSYYWNGYISDVRYNNSTALYTSNDETANVPTAPLSSTGAELHLKGTDASIIDKSQGANLKLIGSTTGSTTQVKFANTKSMYFDGSGDYILTPNSDLFTYGTDDFTIECWVYIPSHPSSYSYLFGQGNSTTNTNSFGVYIQSGVFKIWNGGNIFTGTTSYSLNTWTHLAVSRSGNSLKLYINGNQEGSSVTNTSNISTGSSNGIEIARWIGISDPQYFTGYIQDLRVTKGLARYTATDETSNIPSAPLEG